MFLVILILCVYMFTCTLYLYRDFEFLKLVNFWLRPFRIPNRTYYQKLRYWHKVYLLPEHRRTSWIHPGKSLDPPPSHSRHRTAGWPQSWHRTSPGTSSRGGRCWDTTPWLTLMCRPSLTSGHTRGKTSSQLPVVPHTHKTWRCQYKLYSIIFITILYNMTSIKAPPPSPFLLSSSYRLYSRKCSSYTSSVIIYVDTIETVLIS